LFASFISISAQNKRNQYQTTKNIKKTKQKKSTTHPTNETKTKQQKTRKKIQNKGKREQHSMGMLKLNKTKRANKNKEKIANIPSAHHLSCNVLSSAEREK